ncbi:hypothetical protein [Diaphorobacter aerolatus]|uniref:Uncharacterized protein n=1 Tax=Diaphorobacter aerolatus TaxID=1288495 RepID=A0A7H0GQX3_9BURK|nr:hypothetical protein [Diaphorobacter aerolatus]QNP50689.1 hypothetical protein H9K75_03615 [Diaphorobacter aerolatus]
MSWKPMKKINRQSMLQGGRRRLGTPLWLKYAVYTPKRIPSGKSEHGEARNKNAGLAGPAHRLLPVAVAVVA